MTTDSEPLVLAWTGATFSSWQCVNDEYTIHAAPSSPMAKFTLCDAPVSTPVGWASDLADGRAIVIPFMMAVATPPPHLDGGAWHVCEDCLHDYLNTTNNREKY